VSSLKLLFTVDSSFVSSCSDAVSVMAYRMWLCLNPSLVWFYLRAYNSQHESSLANFKIHFYFNSDSNPKTEEIMDYRYAWRPSGSELKVTEGGGSSSDSAGEETKPTVPRPMLSEHFHKDQCFSHGNQ